jgi:hypothetical protein
MRFIDIPPGSRFGRLVVKERTKNKGEHEATWLCVCDCGKELVLSGSNLRSGNTQSCGCLQRELLAQRVKRHGHSTKDGLSPTYVSWAMMIQRATNPSRLQFKDYCGRGIKICDRWRFGENGKGGFECFLEDVGERPEGKTPDRFPDNDGNYEPCNFRWATRAEQDANKRRRGAKFTDRIGTLAASEAPDSATITLTTL